MPFMHSSYVFYISNVDSKPHKRVCYVNMLFWGGTDTLDQHSAAVSTTRYAWLW